MSTATIDTSAAKDRYTADDLLAMPDGDRFEVVDGQLVERKMGTKADWVAGEIHGCLRDFNRTHPQAWILPEGTTFQCFPDDAQRVRRADTSVVRFGRFADEELPRGPTRIAPDMSVEVVSPHDTFYEVEDKLRDWQSAGVPLVWIVDPEKRIVTVHRLGTPSPIRLTENDEITGDDALPGFRCRVSQFFPPRPKSDEQNGHPGTESGPASPFTP